MEIQHARNSVVQVMMRLHMIINWGRGEAALNREALLGAATKMTPFVERRSLEIAKRRNWNTIIICNDIYSIIMYMMLLHLLTFAMNLSGDQTHNIIIITDIYNDNYVVIIIIIKHA